MAGITVDFNANLARLEDGINRANRQLSGFSDNASRVAGGLRTAFGALGVGLSIAGMTSLVRATLDEADALDKLTAKTGIAQEQLAGLKLAADLSDTNIDAVAQAVSRLSRQIATNGEELANIGVTSRDPLVALEQLADVFVSIEDPALRAATLNKLLGKSWQELAPLLAGGGQALADTVEQGRLMSGITADMARESAEFNDKMTLLSANMQGMRNQAIGPLIPVLNELYDFFNENDDSTDELNKNVGLLGFSYETLAKTIGFVAFSAEFAGKTVGAMGAKLGAILSFDFDHFDAIDAAFKEDIAAASKRLDSFILKVESANLPQLNLKTQTAANIPAAPVDIAGNTEAIDARLGNDKKTQKAIGDSFKTLQSELNRHLRDVEGNIDEEVSLFNFRNRQLEVSLDLGLVSQENYFRQKEQLQKDQLTETEALLDQEIKALKQFQSQATEEAARSDAQEKINELIRKKTDLERDSQIATLENAASARQALGDYAAGLIDINGLIEGTIGNIIGMSKAQAEVNFQTPDQGGATAADLADPNKIFRSADGKSFSDRPATVGVALDLSEDEISKFDDQLRMIKEQAVADSAVLLGVSVDEAAAIAKINDLSSTINQNISEIQPVTINMQADQQSAIDNVRQARDAAQATVQPVIIPVVYQAQNSPGTAASAGDLKQAALASGGR